jgi:hypothetical protein
VTFCRLLSAFVVGPELERAQVVRHRAGLLSPFAPSARAFGATDGFL